MSVDPMRLSPGTCVDVVIQLSQKYPDLLIELLRDVKVSRVETDAKANYFPSDDSSRSSMSKLSDDAGADGYSSDDSSVSSVSSKLSDDYSYDSSDETEVYKTLYPKGYSTDESHIPDASESVRKYEIEPCKRTNTRKCGRCGEIGHYKNTCPLLVGRFPQKKTSTWNSTHKEYASTKYTCEFCGKKEINKCNLDRHKKTQHPIRLSVVE